MCRTHHSKNRKEINVDKCLYRVKALDKLMNAKYYTTAISCTDAISYDDKLVVTIS